METGKNTQDMFAGAEFDIQEIKLKETLKKDVMKNLKFHIVDVFENMVVSQPSRPFILHNNFVYTYEDVDKMACKCAAAFLSLGLKSQDCVAIMMQNEPSFIWTFLGLQKIGVIAALVNCNLTGQSLVHTITAAESRALVVGTGQELLTAVSGILPQLNKLQVFTFGVDLASLPEGISSLDEMVYRAAPAAISPSARSDVKLTDTSCYIYTSGTTGIPKPVYISHMKMMSLSAIPKHLLGLTCDDVMYVVLPLYHSTGAILGLGGVLWTGSTIALRNKFSAQNFWTDCRKFKVTNVIYIGELLRYLLSQPKTENEKLHCVKSIFGAGLRADIWSEIKERFQIPKVYELYGATEAYTAILNLSGKPGSVGRLSPLLSKFDPDHKVLVKFDQETAQPVRDEKGFCTPAGVGKPGLLLSKVPVHLREQKLYKASLENTKKKWVRNVFAAGDVYMNYGDSFWIDAEYNLYFNDRLGDTYRWKGENVSTKEVANSVCKVSFVEDANVYGVEIPGHDGKAGMAAITLTPHAKLGNKELAELYSTICSDLPSYARPLFVRHLPQAVITGTFKNKKVDLAREGYDLNLAQDPLYFLDNANKMYSVLDKLSLSKFVSSKL